MISNKTLLPIITVKKHLVTDKLDHFSQPGCHARNTCNHKIRNLVPGMREMVAVKSEIHLSRDSRFLLLSIESLILHPPISQLLGIMLNPAPHFVYQFLVSDTVFAVVS